METLSPRERFEALLADRAVALHYPSSYDQAIWDTVHALQPAVMIEFGVNRGYIAIIAALALEENGLGHLKVYDCWEEGRRDGFDEERIALDHFAKYGVQLRITLQAMDFYDWLRKPETCDLLYFDIDNDGDKVQAMFEGLRPQIDRGLTILLEGGSKDRDRHDSLAGRRPIGTTQSLTGYQIIVDEFPSLSMISRDRTLPLLSTPI
ncbi:MAG: class I SAM-dependent methyltransferase [Vicinamibacteria bacterium]|jgi:hypothetical protein|nr:class I SAM-dependent methyltransferase [Vicinamibacteria bacterium]